MRNQENKDRKEEEKRSERSKRRKRKNKGLECKRTDILTSIFFRYFIDLTKDEEDEIEFEESTMYSAHNKYIVAHPGWIMGGSALDDFAAPGSFAYLRREVIVWGDSVKLRYGKRPEDAPFLWGYMLEYVKLTAR